MKSLRDYIIESDDDSEGKGEITKTTKRGDIKFTIWKSPEEKLKWLDDNESYQKIEYKLEDKEDHLSIDFLLGFQEDSWKLWIGKIGACTYDDDPYCSFETNKFAEAIVAALDKVEEFVSDVKDDPENYIQYYTNQ